MRVGRADGRKLVNESGVVVQAWNPSTSEAEAGRLPEDPGSSGLQRDALSQKEGDNDIDYSAEEKG